MAKTPLGAVNPLIEEEITVVAEGTVEEEPVLSDNIADNLDEDSLETIASELLAAFEADVQSRKDYEETIRKGMELLGLKLEDSQNPFPGACSAHHPMMIEGAVQFQSQAIKELFPSGGPVKTQIIGEKTEDIVKQANRVKEILTLLKNKGDIYLDEYEGLYSVSEERFITEKEAESIETMLKEVVFDGKEIKSVEDLQKVLQGATDKITDNVEFIVESKSGKKQLYIEGVFLQANIKNRNGRLYPIETLRKEVGRYNENHIQKGRALGELGHPEGPTVNLDRVSHKIISLRESGNNFIGKAKILGTPMGKIAASLVEEGVKLGVSSRGIGSLKATREGVNVVYDDFMLATAADIVADPSAPDAFVEGIMEGKDWVWDGGVLRERMAVKTYKQINTLVDQKKLDENKLNLFSDFLQNI